MKWRIQGRKLPGYYPRLVAILMVVLLIVVTLYYQTRALPRALRDQEAYLRQELSGEKTQLGPVLMVRAEGHLDKGTYMDQAALEQLELREVPLDYLPSGVLSDTGDLSGLICRTPLYPGQMLSESLFKARRVRDGDEYRLVPVLLDHDFLGYLKVFDRVDLLAFLPSGEFNVLASKVPVYQIRPQEEGLEVLLALSDFEERILERAKKTHVFRARLYLDESQPPASFSDWSLVNLAQEKASEDEGEKEKSGPAWQDWPEDKTDDH